MSERNWKDVQRDVLTRLFEAAFERRAASEEQIKSLSRGGHDLGSRRIDLPEALPKSGNG